MKTLKSILLTAMVFCGLTLFTNVDTFATNLTSLENDNTIIEQIDPDFVEVKVEDLSAEVQEAIKQLEIEYNLTLVEYNKEKELTRLTLSSKEDVSVITVLYLDIKGEKVELTDDATIDVDIQEDGFVK